MRRFLWGTIVGLSSAFALGFASAEDSSASSKTKTAIFAGGCFWCIQPAFDKANGVIKTVVVYCGGTEPNPTYELVTSEKTRNRSSIVITYVPAKISYEQYIDIIYHTIPQTQTD